MTSTLLIPIAPLSRTKSRLRDCFSKEQLKELTISMFRDLGNLLLKVDCFDEKIVYCNGSEIVDLADDYGLIGIQEKLTEPRKSFSQVIEDLNNIAINKFNAESTVFTFLDLILISSNNFYEIHELIEKKDLVVCPAIHSGGISILGRNPPDIISSACFSDPNTTSFISLLNEVKNKNISNIAIYDSFRASFDVDIKQDLILAYEYLKVFNMTDSETYKFLKSNLKVYLKDVNRKDNRKFNLDEI